MCKTVKRNRFHTIITMFTTVSFMVLSYYIAIAQPAIVPATQMKQMTPKVTIPRTSKTMSTLFLQRHSKVHCVPQTQVQVSNRYLSREIATETRQKTTFYAIKEKIQIVSIRIIATNKFFGTYTHTYLWIQPAHQTIAI